MMIFGGGGKGVGMGNSIYMYTLLHFRWYIIWRMGFQLLFIYLFFKPYWLDSQTRNAMRNAYLFYLFGYVHEDGLSSHGYILQHIYFTAIYS